MEERGDPHQRVEVRDPTHHQAGECDPSLLEQCDHQVHMEMGLCLSEIEMKNKISIIIKTGFINSLALSLDLGLRGCRRMD